MADNNVFNRLKKLFSTNVVVRNVGGKKLRIADTDQIQSYVNRRGVDRYNRVYHSQTGGYGSRMGRYEASAAFQSSRLQLFRDYDQMDNDPIISSVLDIYSDESATKDEFGRVLSIKSSDTQIQQILENLFYDILNVEFNLWPWIRNMTKYGDLFLYLDIDPEYGIVNVIPLSVYETIRLEGEDPQNPFSVKFSIENDFLNLGKKDFENYEIAHFRLLSDSNFLPYGKAMIEGGRRIWKQLLLMEDAMMIHRIMRSPDKRKFKIDVGNIPPAEIDTYMARIIENTKKTPLIDPKTGDYNLRYNMMNITEDFYFPVRGKESGTDVETLHGLDFNAIEDIQYLLNKLMAAFKVPKAFMGYEQDISGKASLAAQDVRFARTIERIQRVVVSELTKIAVIHLYTQGFTDEKLINFELSLTNPSTLYEYEKLNLWKEKISLAQVITTSTTPLLSQKWVYKNILELSDDEIDNEMGEIESDLKRAAMQQFVSVPKESVKNADGTVPDASPDETDESPSETNESPGETDESSEVRASSQIDDVDQILKTLNASKDEEDDDQIRLKSKSPINKGGRPREGRKVATDGHPLGRDPLGRKENNKLFAREGISSELENMLINFSKKRLNPYKKIMLEELNGEFSE